MKLIDMQLIWIQQWTALPVIIDDLRMSEKNPVGSRSQSSHQADGSLAQSDLRETEGYPSLCQSSPTSLFAIVLRPQDSSRLKLSPF